MAGGLVLLVGLAVAGWGLLLGRSQMTGGAEEGLVEVGVEVPVSATNLDQSRAMTSPGLARDPTTPRLVAAATRGDAPGPDCGLQLSGDGAASWWPVQVAGPLPEGLQACFAPQAAFDGDGRLVYAFVGMTGPPPHPEGVYVATSDDHAQSFSQPRRVAGVDTVASALAATEAGGWQLVWVDRADDGGDTGDGGSDARAGARWPVGDRLLAVGETGRGAGMGDPRVVADPQALITAPVAVSGPDGGVVVAYYRLPAGVGGDADGETLTGKPWDLMVARRPAGAAAFRRPRLVAEVDVPPPSSPFPKLVSRWGIAAPALSVSDEQMCVAWTERVEGALDAWVDCTAADELNAAQAGEPVQVGGDLAGETFQWLPQVAIGPSGRVSALFYHHRHNAEQGKAVDAYYTTTGSDGLDGGFAETVRLSSHSSLPAQAPVSGWFGTRLGLLPAVESQRAVAMWADSRNAVAPANTAQNLMATTVTHPDDQVGTAPGWAGWVGAGLAMAGLGLGAVGRRRQRRHATGRGRTSPEAVAVDASTGAQRP